MEKDVRPMGRTARGVKGIRLGAKDRVVTMEKVEEDHTLLVVSKTGYGKRTDFDQYNAQKRGGGGVITLRTGGKIGTLVGAGSFRDGDELMLISSIGKMIRMAVDEIRVIGRATKGVRLIDLDEGDELVGLARVEEEEGEDIGEENGKEEAPEEDQE